MISVLASIVRFTFRTILLIGCLLFWLFPTLIVVNYYRRSDSGAGSRKADTVAIRLANQLTWLFGVRVKASGTPVSGPVLFAANHVSWLDIPVLHSGCAMGFAGKAEIDQWPIFSYIARTGGTIFYQRGCQDSAAAGMMISRFDRVRA